MSAFSLKWPPVRYFAWLLNKTPLCPCRYIMYVTLTDLQNGDPVYLTRPLSGGLEVALCELTYYHQFYNISAALKNNQIRNEPTTIPNGYYNVCELDKFFQLLNAELTLHSPTGRLQLSTVKRLNLPVMLNSGLAKLLGFSQEIFQPGKRVHRGTRCLGLSPSGTKSVGVAGQRHSMSCTIRGFRLVLFHS